MDEQTLTEILDHIVTALNAVSAGFAEIIDRGATDLAALKVPQKQLRRALESLETVLPPKTDWLRADVQQMLDEIEP